MDQKAAFLLATVGVATSGLTILTVTILRQNTAAPPYLLIPALFLALLYVLTSAVIIWVATAVFGARTHGLRRQSTAPGLLFPLIVLEKHRKDEDAYAGILAATSFGDLLAEYSNQVMEVSHIYSVKQRRINTALLLFQALLVMWALELVLLGIVSVV